MRRARDRIDGSTRSRWRSKRSPAALQMSAGYLSRQFRLAFSESPYSYLMKRRIERAMALLRRGNLSVTEVSFAVG